MILRLNCNSLTNWQYKGVPHTMRLYQLNISQVFKVFMRKCSNIQTPTIVADRYIFLYTFLGYYITDLYTCVQPYLWQFSAISWSVHHFSWDWKLDQLEGESHSDRFAIIFEDYISDFFNWMSDQGSLFCCC